MLEIFFILESFDENDDEDNDEDDEEEDDDKDNLGVFLLSCIFFSLQIDVSLFNSLFFAFFLGKRNKSWLTKLLESCSILIFKKN